MDLISSVWPEQAERLHQTVKTTMIQERWYRTTEGTFWIPSEKVLRSNFREMDRAIEAVDNFIASDYSIRTDSWWDDSQVDGKTCKTLEDVEKAAEFLVTQEFLACDIETRNVGYTGTMNKILLIGFAYAPYKAVVIPYRPEFREYLRKIFGQDNVKYCWHNGKFDTSRLKVLVEIEARIDEDTMLLHYACINEKKGTHGLKDLGQLYLQAPAWDDKLQDYKKEFCRLNRIKLSEFQYDMIPQDVLIPYLYRDCCATYQLFKKWENLPAQRTNMYRNLIKAANVFKDIESAGCLIDQDYLYVLQEKLDDMIVDAQRVLRAELAQVWDPMQYVYETGARSVPSSFNHKSPAQLKWILEKVCGRKLESTNKETMDALIEEFPDKPLLQAIASLRKYNKYMDTYVEGFKKLMDDDGRVRASFNLHGTETGRLSCSDPNMQNVPRLKLIKNLIIAPKGYKLVQFDYSQAELRVLAYLSQDEYLRNSYRQDRDLHDAMAERIFGPGFTKEQRVAAKTINFGIPYGRGAGSMASKMHMTIAQASQTIRDWFAAAPGAQAFVTRMRKIPYGSEPYTTVFGRQRKYVVTYDNRNHAENEAVNFPISSIASDLTLLSVIEIHDWILRENLDARIVNTVHDSIILEVRDNPALIHKVGEFGKATMANMPKKYLVDPPLDFPFKADFEAGPSWGALEKEEGLDVADLSESNE